MGNDPKGCLLCSEGSPGVSGGWTWASHGWSVRWEAPQCDFVISNHLRSLTAISLTLWTEPLRKCVLKRTEEEQEDNFKEIKTTSILNETKREKLQLTTCQNKSLHTFFCVFVFYSFFLIEMYCKVIICHSSHYMAWCTRSTTPIYRRNTRKHTQGFTMGKQEV